MIGREHRFHGLGSLNFAYRKGRVHRGPFFALRCIANPRAQTWRAAVVVSRKVHKSAVVRNRIRRRLYELLRLELAQLDRPHDIIINVFSDRVASLEYAELRQAVRASLRAAGLI